MERCTSDFESMVWLLNEVDKNWRYNNELSIRLSQKVISIYNVLGEKEQKQVLSHVRILYLEIPEHERGVLFGKRGKRL